MKLIEITGMPKATSVEDLSRSIKNGKFNKDGSNLRLTDDFNCRNRKLISLIGCPQNIPNGFYCELNKLTSLKGCPSKVGGNFYCSSNELTSFKWCPQEIGESFSCERNPITSLRDVHKHIKKMHGYFFAENTPIKSHVLGLLKIQGFVEVILDNKKVEAILNKYLAGSRDLLDCQEELIEAGFEEYAQL